MLCCLSINCGPEGTGCTLFGSTFGIISFRTLSEALRWTERGNFRRRFRLSSFSDHRVANGCLVLPYNHENTDRIFYIGHAEPPT